MKLKDKVALITGGATGIGKSIALTYAKEGAVVLIASRNESALSKAAEEIRKYSQADYIVCDVSQIDDVTTLSRFVKDKYGRLDVLVNNASILGERQSIVNSSIDVWKSVIDININGTFYVTKSLLPLMIESHARAIINISSGVGREGRKEWGAYSVSKFGVEAFTQILSQELDPHHICVNSVNPGRTRTKMRAEAYPNENPMTLPKPDGIMDVFLYLVDDQSNNITGSSFDAQGFQRT